MASAGRMIGRSAGAIAALTAAGWLAVPAYGASISPGATPSPGASETASPATSLRRAPEVGAIEVTSPRKDAGGVVLQSSARAPHDGLAIQGTVTGTDRAPAPFVPVTFSGSSGVYFSVSKGPLTTSPDDDLAPSLVGATAANGEIPPVYAYFTKSGFNRITISSGAVSRSVTVIAPNATDPYRVSVGSISGNPGARLVVMGTVLDAFGNPVPNLSGGLSLSTGDPSLGSLESQSPGTDVSGMFSTAFRASDTRKGIAELVVQLTGATTDPQPDPAWKDDAGLDIPHGTYQGRATITLSGRVRFSATPSLLGGGKARLRGTAKPGTAVSIYAKPAGYKHSTKIGEVIANAEGNWGIGTSIATTTSFRARTSGVATSILTTTVQSNQTVRAEGLGYGRVQFIVHGMPHVRGVVTIYENGQQLAGVATDAHGGLTTVLQTKPGSHTFHVYFEAPGTKKKGRTVTGTVR